LQIKWDFNQKKKNTNTTLHSLPHRPSGWHG
jgi:hypothetical protein